MKIKTCGLMLGVCLATSAQADEERGTTANFDGAPTVLDEIVVTATRRAQLQRNVPLSITTLTGAKLTEMGATKFDEYAPVVPGLSYTNCGCTPGEKYTFRGIATDGIKSSVRPLTAVYFDETPITYASGVSTIAYTADPDLIDIDRVEILRGPQGTLFGANAMGGAIRIIPRAPDPALTESFLAAEALTITDGGQGFGAGAMTNIPLPGRAALRGVGYYRYKEGYIDTAPLGQRDVNDDQTGGLRLSGLYEPTDALSLTGRFAYQKRDSDGGPAEQAGTSEPTRTRIHALEPNHDDWSLATVGADYAGDGVRLVATTSWLERRPYHTRDFTPAVQLQYGVDVLTQIQAAESARELTQEIRVQSDTGAALDWLMGVFFQNQDTGFSLNFPSPGFDAAHDNDAAKAGLPDNLGRSINRGKVRNYALFGDLSYRIVENWELGLGARGYLIQSESFSEARGLLQGSSNPITDSGETEESGLTPKLSLLYQPSSELSFFSVIAKGFRPGGINAVTPACQQGQLAAGLGQAPRNFKSDTLWSYELGAKTSWLADRLHASGGVFHTNWDDIQTRRAAGCGLVSFTDNSGKARANGVELTLTTLLFEGLELELNETYTDARFAEDSLISRKRKGDPVTDVPRNVLALAATYALPHPASFMRLDYQLRGSTPNDPGNGTRDTLPSYEQLHARLVWGFSGMQLTLSGRNLLNERGAFSRQAFAGALYEIRVPPRTISVGLQYPF